MKKIVKRVVISLFVIVLAILVGFYALFHHEIKTMASVEKVNAYPLYTMEYDGDYGIDEFLETGASNDGELVEFVVKKILKGLPIEIKIPSLGCSTFLAKNADGQGYLFGRNFDLSYAPGMFVKTKPDHGYASISMVNLGFLGYGENKLPDSFTSRLLTLAAPYAPLDGMNEKGLCVGVLLIPTEETNQQTDKVDITTTTAIRMLLDKAASVDEAVDMLKQYDMHSSANSCYHFQISDASGKSVVVEYIDNEMSVVKSNETYQAATNFLLTPGDYDFGKGQDRYETMITTLHDTAGVLTNEEAMDLLQTVAQDEHEDDRGKLSWTQWSVIYDTEKLDATIVMNREANHPFHYSLD